MTKWRKDVLLNGREYVLGTNRSIRRYQDLDTITFIQFYRLHLQIQQKKDTRMCPTFQLEVSRILGRRGWEIKCWLFLFWAKKKFFGENLNIIRSVWWPIRGQDVWQLTNKRRAWPHNGPWDVISNTWHRDHNTKDPEHLSITHHQDASTIKIFKGKKVQSPRAKVTSSLHFF